MDINEHFLQTDMLDAYSELMCAAHCMHVSATKMQNGNYKHATVYLENALRSVRELERLNEKKTQHDKLNSLVTRLSNENVKVMILRRK